jgi:hypothetical protein
MGELNGPISAGLLVFPSAARSTGALLATAALPATGPTAALLAATAALLATTLAALLATTALSATGTVAALLTATSFLAATLAALRAQHAEVIIPIVQCAVAVPNLWSFHGVLPFHRRSSA